MGEKGREIPGLNTGLRRYLRLWKDAMSSKVAREEMVESSERKVLEKVGACDTPVVGKIGARPALEDCEHDCRLDTVREMGA